MCSPIALRMCDERHDLSPGRGSRARTGATGVAAGAGCRRPGDGTPVSAPQPAARAAAMAASTSCFVIRPPVPVPAIADEVEVVLGRELPHQRRQDLRPRPRSGIAGAVVAAAAAGAGPVPSGLGRGDRLARRRPLAGILGAGSSAESASAAAAAAAAGGRVRRPSRSPRARCRPARSRLRHEDLRHGAGDRRGDLGVDLVGGDLEQRLVALDRVALVLEPFQDRAFDDRLAELGHLDRGHGSSPPGSACRGSPCGQPLDGGLDVGDLRQDTRPRAGGERHGRVRRGQPLTGASRCSNAFSAIIAATSAPTPRNRCDSYSTSAREVFAIDLEHGLLVHRARSSGGRRPRPRRPWRRGSRRPPAHLCTIAP